MSITIDNVKALGGEIRRAREAKGIPSVRELSRIANLGYRHLQQIETAYTHPKRGFTVPSDTVLDSLASALDVPVSRFHALLGRFPDVPYPEFTNPETYYMAEQIDRLPPLCRRFVTEAIRGAQTIAGEMQNELEEQSKTKA